jgi:hypothetical protein
MIAYGRLDARIPRLFQAKRWPSALNASTCANKSAALPGCDALVRA